MKVLLPGVAAALLAAGPAVAAPPWSPPVDGSPADHAGAARIAFDIDGRSLLAYETPGDGESLTHVVTPGRERVLSGSPTGLVRTGDRSFLLVRRKGSRIVLARLDSDGRGRGRRVAAHASDHALASNIRARGAVAWVDARDPEGPRVRVRLVNGRRLEAPITLGRTGRVSDVAVTVGPRGETAILWSEQRGTRRRVLARSLSSRRKGRFGRPLVMGRHGGQVEIGAAYGSSGRLFVAYTSQDAGEEAGRPLDVRWATVSPSGRRVGARGMLDRGDALERPLGRLRLEATADGATLAYTMVLRRTGESGTVNQVRIASADRGGRFGPPATLATDAALGDMAQSPTDVLVATWFRVDGFETNAIEAAVKPLGGTFGPVEEIATGEAVTAPSAAFSPATGRPTVAWTAAPAPGAPARVRLSERTG